MHAKKYERLVFGVVLVGLLATVSGCGLKTRSVPTYENGQYVGQQTETYIDGNEFTKDLFSTLVGVTVGVVTFNAMGGDCSTDWFSSEWFVSGMAGEAAAGAATMIVDEAERRESAAGNREDTN